MDCVHDPVLEAQKVILNIMSERKLSEKHTHTFTFAIWKVA